MDWAKDYIRRCLTGIPKSEYRNRLRSELTDHLKLLVGDLEATGRTTEEARTDALRQMGDAKELNAGCWAEWLRQPERVRWDISRFVLGILLAGAGFLCAVALMLFSDTINAHMKINFVFISFSFSANLHHFLGIICIFVIVFERY